MEGNNNLDIKNFQIYPSVSDEDRILMVIAKTGGDASMTVALLRNLLLNSIQPSIKKGIWFIGPNDTGVTAEGRTPQLRLGETGIEYRYADTDPWVLLVALDLLKLHFDDLTQPQKEEIRGENIYLQVTPTHIQWKIGQTGEWQNLIAREELKGDKGDNPEFRTSSGGIEWRYANVTPEDAWKPLVSIEALKLTFDMLSPAQKEEIRGYSSFQLWQQEPGNEQKTYEEYKAYLKQEVTDAADICNQNEEVRKRDEQGRKDSETARVTAEKNRVVEHNQMKLDTSKLATRLEDDIKAANTAKDQTIQATSDTKLATENTNKAIKAAETATSNANTQAKDAQTQANRAKEYSDHPTKMGDNGNWWKWDEVKKDYVDTGVLAKGGIIYPTFGMDDELRLYMDYEDTVSPTLFGYDEEEGMMYINS